jgi:hypothetical protein
LITQHVKGAVGLKAGSQPPPGGYVPLPIVYFYNTDKVKDRNGDTLPGNADLTSAFFGVGYSQVTSKKILAGFYGFAVLFPVGRNNRIQGTEIDANPGAGITDSAFTPISLGWHRTRADFIHGIQHLCADGQVHRRRQRQHRSRHVGIRARRRYDGVSRWRKALARGRRSSRSTSSRRRKTATRRLAIRSTSREVWALTSSKAGSRRAFAYYASFKVSEDDIEGLPGDSHSRQEQGFGLGPEATLAIAAKNKVYGFVTVRYFWETLRAHDDTGQFVSDSGDALDEAVTVPGPDHALKENPQCPTTRRNQTS